MSGLRRTLSFIRTGKWCCMELLDYETGKVLGVRIMSKKEAGKSILAEAAAIKKGLEKVKRQLEEQGKRIVEVVHDCNKAVSTVIKEVLPDAYDSMDMWHVTKGKLKESVESLVSDYQELEKLDQELKALHPVKGKGGLFSMVKNHFYYSAEQSRLLGTDDVYSFAVRFVDRLLHHLCENSASARITISA
jgi:gas vesicle protein